MKGLDKQRRMIAEKRMTDILFDLDMGDESFKPQSHTSGTSGYPYSDGYYQSQSTAGGHSNPLNP